MLEFRWFQIRFLLLNRDVYRLTCRDYWLHSFVPHEDGGSSASVIRIQAWAFEFWMMLTAEHMVEGPGR